MKVTVMKLREDLARDGLIPPIVLLHHPDPEINSKKDECKYLDSIFPPEEEYEHTMRFDGDIPDWYRDADDGGEDESYLLNVDGGQPYNTIVIRKGVVFLCIGIDFEYVEIEWGPDISSTWHPGHEPQMGSYDH